jgi:hypothetical protein
VLNIIATAVFASLIWLTVRGEGREPAHAHAGH